MFKKDIRFSSHNTLSGKDRKNLKQNLGKVFDDEKVDLMLGVLKDMKLQVQKVKGMKMSIVSDEQNRALLVDCSGKGDYFPSLQMLYLEEKVVESVVLNSGVEKFIFNGANLMWPGVKQVPEQWSKDDVVVIRNSDRIMVGVGAMVSDSSHQQHEGVAVYLLHHLNDKLYEMGGPSMFKQYQLKQQQQQDDDDQQHDNINQVINVKQEQEQEQDDEQQDDEQQDDGIIEQMQQQIKKKEKKKVKKQEDNIYIDSESDQQNSSQQKDKQLEHIQMEMKQIQDDYLYEAFMNAIKMIVTDKELPIDPSVLFSYMVQCKRESVQLDVKNSSYKKIGKFFQMMNKQGLIEYKEGKKGGNPMIIKIKRNCEKYQDWETLYDIKIEQTDNKPKQKEALDERMLSRIEVNEMFKIKKEYQGVLKADGQVTMGGLKELLNQYIKQNDLQEKKVVNLDCHLAKLFGTEQNKVKMDKDVLVKRLDEAVLPCYRIRWKDSGKEELKGGLFKGVHMIAEKAHNKNITRIQGIEQFGIDVAVMSQYLQIKYASSVTYHETQGKNNVGKEIIIQGKFLSQLTDLMVNECKIDRKHISQLNKLDRKKK